MGDERGLMAARATETRLPDMLVRRPRLEALLADASRRPVTLVSAPPGSGKTTLAAAWSTSRPQRDVIPLSLDDRDNERDELAGVVTAALVDRGALGPGEVDATLADTRLLDAVFARLERRGERRILVLDDLQELTSPDALHTLVYLVERAPDMLQLVLCTRADPPIRLTRLRLAGQLGEIRYRDLAFDLAETAVLLEARGLRLTHEQVKTLWRRTNGWVAGLRLAAGALQVETAPTEFVRSMGGTESEIADYLLGELLTRQDDGLQRFMLRTSVVERLTPDLARQLTDDPDAEARLAELERNGVFLAELDGRTWHRYHPLFATLLNGSLRQRHRGLADELHRRAAAWLVANDMPAEAEAHAIAAADWPLVSRLAGQRWVARMLDGGELDDDLLPQRVPAHAIAANDGLLALAAADACRRGDRTAADAHRLSLDRLSGPGVPLSGGATSGTTTEDQVTRSAGAGSVDGHSAVLPVATAAPPSTRLVLDVLYGRTFGVDPRARDAVAHLRDGAQCGSDPGIALAADLWDVGFDLDEGRIERARQRALALALAAGSTRIGVRALAMLALAEAVDGRVTVAARYGDRVAGEDLPARASARRLARLAAALCHAQRGEHRRALDELAETEVLDGADRWWRAVDRTVHTALATPGSAFVGVDVDDAAHPLVARTLVALGVLEAVDVTGRVRPLGGPWEQSVLLARQRWHARDPAGVITALAGPSDRGLESCHPRTLIERFCLLALATAERGDEQTAVVALRDALHAADQTGVRAPLLVLLPDLRTPLAAHADDFGRHEGLALELVDRSPTATAPAFIEPLTKRERAVLRHLPTLMSNREIAATMHLSVNTVKTHLKSLYRKLGAVNRREAVLRARSLELV